MALTEDEEFELLSLEREKAMAKKPVINDVEEKKRFGVFGSVPEKAYQAGERNIAGDIFERPGAAIRSALMGRGYVEGAINPTNVPRFQDMAIKAAQQSTSPLVNAAIGMPASAAGLAADVVTNPADMLGMMVGKTPIGGGRNIGQAVADTAPAQAFQKWLTATRQAPEVKMPQLMTDNWLTQKAKDVKGIVDKTLGDLRSQYGAVFSKEGNKKVSSGINSIPKDYQDEFGLTPDSTISDIWAARDRVLADIADGAWDRSDYYKKIRPRQEDLINASQKMKAVVLNNMSKDSREVMANLDPTYEESIKLGRKLIRTVYEPSSDTYKVKPLINAFRDKENAGTREAFKRFEKLNGNISKVKGDINSYIRRQAIKDAAKKAAVTAILGGGAIAGIKSAVK